MGLLNLTKPTAQITMLETGITAAVAVAAVAAVVAALAVLVLVAATCGYGDLITHPQHGSGIQAIMKTMTRMMTMTKTCEKH